jgi:phosphatidylinositol alpha-1,6-mannosyltransferase
VAEIRLLVLTPEFPPARGGIQHLLHRLVSNLKRLRAGVVALYHEGAMQGIEFVAAAEVRRVGRLSAGAGHKTAIAGLNAWSVRRALDFKPHVVLSGHVVVSPAARAISRAVHAPYVQYVHGSEVLRRPGMTRFACLNASAVVAVSEYTRGLVSGFVKDPGRLHLIPPGVDIPSDRRRSRSSTPIVLNVARMAERYKGHDVLIRALPLVRARVPGARLVIVGEGPLRPVYEAMASRLGLDGAVRFLGSVSDEERDRWFERAHVFAMPSRLSPSGGEGFGIVHLEAGAHELAVVAGAEGGSVDAVVDGETGLLVDPTDHVAVAQALTLLLTDRRRAGALGRAGAARAREFAWPLIARRVEDLLLTIADRHGPGLHSEGGAP